MPQPTITVLVGTADDERVVADPAGPGLDVVGRVATGNEVLTRAIIDLPDVLVLDGHLLDVDARSVCGRLGDWAPAVRTVLVARSDDERSYAALAAGAHATVRSGLRARELRHVLTGAARGEGFVLPRVATRILADIDALAARIDDPMCPPPTLTDTEREVLRLLGRGISVAKIADLYDVTPRLINVHTGYAVAKLHRYAMDTELLASIPS